MENCKNIIGYDGLYSINTKGEVFSLRNYRGLSNRKLKYSKNKYGYLRVSLTKDKKTKGITVHKLMTTTFIGERPKNKQVRHLDGNKENNNLDNLKYGTALENANDRRLHFKTATGEKVGSSKLSFEDVNFIRNSSLSQKKLSEKFNVTIANISMIINYKSRKNG